MTLTAAGGLIANGTENVILYCVCRIEGIAVGPTQWFIDGTQVALTQANGTNPYYRDNIPSPLIISSFTTTHVATYGCNGLYEPTVTTDLALIGICNLSLYCYTILYIIYNYYII